MSNAELFGMISKLPEEQKKSVSDYIAFLVSQTGTDTEEKESFSKVEGNPERGFGSLKGKIWMSPDFDEPIEDFKDYM